MDSERIEAEISKINFLLENLWATHLRDAGVSHEDVPQLADELSRQALLPAGQYGGGDEASVARQQDLVAHRIQMFFVAIRDRLRQVQEPDSPE